MDAPGLVCVVAPDTGPILAPFLADLSAVLRANGFEPVADPSDESAAPYRKGDEKEGAAELRKLTVSRTAADARLAEMDESDAVLALLDGTDVDAGVAARVAWAAAFGTPVVGLRLDPRPPGPDATATVNAGLARMIGRSGGSLVTSLPAAVNALTAAAVIAGVAAVAGAHPGAL